MAELVNGLQNPIPLKQYYVILFFSVIHTPLACVSPFQIVTAFVLSFSAENLKYVL